MPQLPKPVVVFEFARILVKFMVKNGEEVCRIEGPVSMHKSRGCDQSMMVLHAEDELCRNS